MEVNLSEIKEKQTCVITQVEQKNSIFRRLNDLGFVNGTAVTCLNKSRNHNIASYRVRSAVIALREEDARTIKVKLR